MSCGNDDQLASALIEKLFDLVFSRPSESATSETDLGQRLATLKKLL